MNVIGRGSISIQEGLSAHNEGVGRSGIGYGEKCSDRVGDDWEATWSRGQRGTENELDESRQWNVASISVCTSAVCIDHSWTLLQNIRTSLVLQFRQTSVRKGSLFDGRMKNGSYGNQAKNCFRLNKYVFHPYTGSYENPKVDYTTPPHSTTN